jgi:RNA polymerase sigma factor (TIGR02999 family)
MLAFVASFFHCASPLPRLAAILLVCIIGLMNEVTRTLTAIEEGDPHAAAQLLPLVYDELRKLAAGHMANEAAGHTLDATALVHEAYLRLVGPVGERSFANRTHFFAAAADAMRRILVDSARRKKAHKRGGDLGPSLVDVDRLPAPAVDADFWIDLDGVLTAFEKIDVSAAELATLRIFGGLSVEEAAEALGISRASAFRVWTYARAWLTAALADPPKNT